MKIVMWALFLVGVYFIYQFTIAKVFGSYDDCYEKAKTEIAESSVSKSNKCSNEKSIYEEMNSCVASIQESGNFAGFLYQASDAQNKIVADIELHNTECAAHKLNPPKEAFYMSAGAKR